MKAVLVDAEGREQGSSTTATPFVARGDTVEMPFDALVGSLARLLAELGGGQARVAAVGVAGVAESGAGIDGDGRPVSPVMAWHDPRGEEIVERILDQFGDGLARRIGQPLRTVSSVAKLGWLVDQGVTQPARWLGVPELCLFHLTGAAATEHSLAARTGCYDVLERRWMPEVTELLGLPSEVFAEVMSAGTVMGRISAEGSGWSGLGEGTVVTIAGHDHLAGAEAVGATAGDLVNSVGTAETVMRRLLQEPDMERALALKAALTVRPGGEQWIVLASGARAGLVLDAATGALGRTLQDLDELAEETSGPDDERVEVSDDSVRRMQAGETPRLPDGPPGQVWKALLRALTRRTLESAGRLEELLGPAERMIVFGGGSRSRPWMQAKAEASQLPVLRAGAPEAVARGAAAMAGVAAGWWPSAETAPRPDLEEVSSGSASARTPSKRPLP